MTPGVFVLRERRLGAAADPPALRLGGSAPGQSGAGYVRIVPPTK
jgi:hypothetical protein